MKRAKRHGAPKCGTMTVPMPKPRNPVARSPLMRKGGAHGRSRAAERREANVALRKLARDPKSFDES
jgi:hypothetical protein